MSNRKMNTARNISQGSNGAPPKPFARLKTQTFSTLLNEEDSERVDNLQVEIGRSTSAVVRALIRYGFSALEKEYKADKIAALMKLHARSSIE